MSDRYERIKANPEQLEKHLARSRRWKEEHPEERRKYHREYCRKWRKKHKSKVKKYNKKWKQNNPDWQDQAYFNAIKRKYGITKEAYLRMAENQGNKCKICGEPDTRRLHLDHNHSTGQVRDLLCNECNLGIGYFKDNTALLLKVIEYLDRHNNSTV